MTAGVRIGLFWEDATVGTVLPAVEMPISYRHLIHHVGAGRDYMRGHHDPAFAREQGKPDIYLNTLFHQSFVDRVMTDWAGGRAFIKRRKIAMRESIYPGDLLSGSGQVSAVYEDDGARGLVDVEIELRTHNGLCCAAWGTLILPRTAGC